MAALMLWLETACAPLVCTEALAWAAEGERLALPPVALGAEAEAGRSRPSALPFAV